MQHSVREGPERGGVFRIGQVFKSPLHSLKALFTFHCLHFHALLSMHVDSRIEITRLESTVILQGVFFGGREYFKHCKMKYSS